MTRTGARAALGFAFAIASDDPVFLAEMTRLFADLPPAAGPAALITASRHEGRVRLDLDGEPLGERTDLRGLVELVVWEVNRRAAASVGDVPVLHGAVVGGRPRRAGEVAGGAVVVCGASQSGKSTLAAAAARAGWTHLSDDLAPLEQRGHAVVVRPFPRPVMLRPGGRALLGLDDATTVGESFVAASELGATVTGHSLPLRAVIVLARSDDVALEPLRGAEALHEMIHHSATIESGGADEFRALERVARMVPAFRLRLGPPAAALDLLAPLVT